ncbi:MAG: PEP-CTERM sorting domain-containing protein [Verrucomicrobiota bacterium]
MKPVHTFFLGCLLLAAGTIEAPATLLFTDTTSQISGLAAVGIPDSFSTIVMDDYGAQSLSDTALDGVSGISPFAASAATLEIPLALGMTGNSVSGSAVISYDAEPFPFVSSGDATSFFFLAFTVGPGLGYEITVDASVSTGFTPDLFPDNETPVVPVMSDASIVLSEVGVGNVFDVVSTSDLSSSGGPDSLMGTFVLGPGDYVLNVTASVVGGEEGGLFGPDNTTMGDASFSFDFSFSAIPEPSSLVLFMLGAGGALIRRR